ncbi:MAG: hypothetical protein WAK18_14865 [Nocardioidaceae bacterium]
MTKLHLVVGIPAFGVLLLVGLGANVASAEPVPTGTVPTDTSTPTDTLPTDTLPTVTLTTDPTTATSSSPPPTSTAPTSTGPATTSTAPSTSTTSSTTAPSTTSNPTTQGTTGTTSSPQSPIPTQITITGPNGGVQTISQDSSAPLPAQGLFLGAAVGGADKSGRATTGAGSAGGGSNTLPPSSSDLVTPASLETEALAGGPGPTRILIVTLLAVAALTGLIYGYTRWYDAHR